MYTIVEYKCKICGGCRVREHTDVCHKCEAWALRLSTEKWPVTRSKRVNEQIKEYILDGQESSSSMMIFDAKEDSTPNIDGMRF